MNELLVRELKVEELLVVDGGNCTLKGVAQSVGGGALWAAVTGGGALVGAIGGGVVYGATCWW